MTDEVNTRLLEEAADRISFFNDSVEELLSHPAGLEQRAKTSMQLIIDAVDSNDLEQVYTALKSTTYDMQQINHALNYAVADESLAQ